MRRRETKTRCGSVARRSASIEHPHALPRFAGPRHQMNRAVDGAHGVVIAIERLLPPFGRDTPGAGVANDSRARNLRERVRFFLGRDPTESYGGSRLQAP